MRHTRLIYPVLDTGYASKELKMNDTCTLAAALWGGSSKVHGLIINSFIVRHLPVGTLVCSCFSLVISFCTLRGQRKSFNFLSWTQGIARGYGNFRRIHLSLHALSSTRNINCNWNEKNAQSRSSGGQDLTILPIDQFSHSSLTTKRQ